MRRAVRAAPGFRSSWSARAALIPATRLSGTWARDPCRSVTRSRNRAVLVAFLECGAGAAAAGGDRALGQDPGAEPGQGAGGGQGQAEQPQEQAAEEGQRGGGVAGQVLVAGQGLGADDADQGVAGQGVGGRGQGPDGEVPPAGFGRDGVHEHAGADGGQVERPGAQRAAAVQGCSRPFTSCRPGEMRNERLRALLLERGKTPGQLAEHVRVDAKTVERWITRGRLPYRRHRFEVASSSAWMSPASGPTRWARTRSPRYRKARSWRCGRTAPRSPGHLGTPVLRRRAGNRRAGLRRAVLVRGRRSAEDHQGQGQFGRAGTDPAR